MSNKRVKVTFDDDDDEVLDHHGDYSSAEEEEEDWDSESSSQDRNDNLKNLEKTLTFEERLLLREIEEEEKRRKRKNDVGGGDDDEKESDVKRMSSRKREREERVKNEGPKKRHKTAPTEMSSKVRVPMMRNVLNPKFVPKKPVSRDPRFEVGDERFVRRGKHLKTKAKRFYDPRYEHVYELQKEEMETLKKVLRDQRDRLSEKDVKEAQRRISVLNNMLVKQRRDKLRYDLYKKYYEDEADKVSKGKKPRYLSQRELDRMVKEQEFEELKKSGGKKLEKKLEKIRKRQKSSLASKMPTRRRKDHS